MPKYWSVPREWAGQRAFIVGGGPSVEAQNLDVLRGRKVIAVNKSFAAVPFADFCFFGDNRFYREYEKPLLGFAGRIVSVASCPMNDRVLRLKKRNPPGLSDDPQTLIMLLTSLHGAIDLAKFLVGPLGSIALLGADGKAGPGGRSHHHKPHPWPVRPGCWDRQLKDLMTVRKPLKRLGIELLNCSPGSAWTDLCPYVPLEEALCRPLPSASRASDNGTGASTTRPG